MKAIPLSNGRPALYVVSPLLALLIFLPNVVFCQGIQPLLSDLADKNPEVRRRALQAKELTSCYSVEAAEEFCASLSEEDFRRLTDALLELLKDQDARIREQALWYLRHSTEPRTIKAIARLLQDSDDDVRADAAGKFSHTVLHDPEIVRTLEGLLKDRDGRVRSGAAMSLGLSGTQQSLSLLRDAYNREGDEIVKLVFADVIRRLERRIGKKKSDK